VEVNQSVQETIFRVDGPGTFRDVAGQRVSIVAGKDTVVRYYLVADGAQRPDFSAQLQIRVWRAGESSPSLSLTFAPNANVHSITVPPDPGESGRQGLLNQLRTDLNQTLNFVIPGDLLEEAALLDLTLEDVTGLLQVPVRPRVTLGLYTIYIARPGSPGLVEHRVRSMIDHLKAAYPVSEVLIPHLFEARWDTAPWATVVPFMSRFFTYTGSSRCGKVLSRIKSTFSGDSLPAVSAPDYVVTFGVASGEWLEDCVGLAYLSGPPSAISYADSNAAPQEIGHTMGIDHASNAHGEASGGGYEPWPYPHGMMSPDGITMFGVIAQQTAVTADSLGEWRVTLVDPCPSASLSQRIDDCSSLGESVMHDFMSYGPYLPWTEKENVFGSDKAFRWPSDITYERIYGKILTGELFPPSGSLTPASTSSGMNPAEPTAEERVETLIISGVVHEDGTTELLDPLIRKPLPPSLLAEGLGSFTLELQDGSGNTLLQQSFDMDHIGHDDKDGLFWLAVKYVEGIKRLIIRQQDHTLLETVASPNAPQVRVTSPNGGEILTSGEHKITWEASDPDGGPLSFLVQYSPDNGQSWLGITWIESGSPQETQLRVEELISGRQGIIRITASDGFNTSIDHSDAFFSLGTEEAPDPLPPSNVYLPIVLR
jgi:hypothetical protein